MSALRQAAQQALEALENHSAVKHPQQIHYRDSAIEALRSALAEPEQEPLEYWNAVEGWVKIDEVRQHFDSVGCGTIYKTSGDGRQPLYTAPPQRKPLTEEEINKLKHTYDWAAGWTLERFARAIEQAHGIKGDA